MGYGYPRYAYQIADNYHTNSSTGGTINIKFMKDDTNIAADGTSTWQKQKWSRELEYPIQDLSTVVQASGIWGSQIWKQVEAMQQQVVKEVEAQ